MRTIPPEFPLGPTPGNTANWATHATCIERIGGALHSAREDWSENVGVAERFRANLAWGGGGGVFIGPWPLCRSAGVTMRPTLEKYEGLAKPRDRGRRVAITGPPQATQQIQRTILRHVPDKLERGNWL